MQIPFGRIQEIGIYRQVRVVGYVPCAAMGKQITRFFVRQFEPQPRIHRCVFAVKIVRGFVHVCHIGTERQYAAGLCIVDDGGVERGFAAQTVYLQQVSAGFVFRVGVVVLQVPVAVVLHRVFSSRCVSVVVTRFDEPEQTRLAGHMVCVGPLLVVRIIHTRNRLRAYYRVIGVVASEILAEEQLSLHAQFFFTFFGFETEWGTDGPAVRVLYVFARCYCSSVPSGCGRIECLGIRSVYFLPREAVGGEPPFVCAVGEHFLFRRIGSECHGCSFAYLVQPREGYGHAQTHFDVVQCKVVARARSAG